MPGELDIDYHEHEPIVLKDLERKERLKDRKDPSDALRKAGL